jgi:heat shock protein HtpX
LPEVSSKEQALNKRILLLSFVPIIAGFALIYIKNYVLSPDNSFRIYLFPLALLIIAFGPHLVRHVFKKPLEEIVVKDMQDHDIDLHRREEESEQVRNRAFSLAQKMGVSLGGLDIDESMTGRRYASAVVLMNNRVKVSRMALEVLSPTELDFILAHEIAHIKEKDIAKQSATLLISMLLIMSPFFLRYTRITLHPTLTSDLMLFAVPMSGMILLFGLSFWLSKRREYKADQLALMETRDVKSAQSALVNMIRRSPLPYAHDFDEASTHPRISKRLEALRQIAKEIGLSSITQTD